MPENAAPASCQDAARSPGTPGSFLFLQGPFSSFFEELGRALIERGHRVQRINLHLGDQLCWRLPAIHYRGRFEDWRWFIGETLERERISAILVHGDRRPYHVVAAEEARARGIAVFTTDLGYVRPDWLTLERDGMTSYSRFPRDPQAIRSLAEQFPEPDLVQRYSTPFRLLAALDVVYNFGLVFGRPLYRHYRYHGIFHPFAEYAGWLASLARRRLKSRETSAALAELQAAKGSYFLFPLQLATDYQIRAHSPFVHARDAVRDVIASFAASGSRRRLVLIVHPLDNGLIGWRRLAMGYAERHGVADRVTVLDGGVPLEVLGNAAGVVTINSTIGCKALELGVPVKALGYAVFDVPGLTEQGSLDNFWRQPTPPDPKLMAAFLCALIGATQVKGGYYEPSSRAAAVAGFVERLEQGPYPLPLPDLAARRVRDGALTVTIAGASSPLGLAVARAYAGPGVNLCLLGGSAASLARAAEDCRRRGAEVKALARDAPGWKIDAADQGPPTDILIIDTGSAELGSAIPGLAMMDRDPAGIVGRIQPWIERMRERRRGRVVLIDTAAAHGSPVGLLSAPADPRPSLLAIGGRLRDRLRADNVGVSVVCASRDAADAAARQDEEIASVAPDRAADQIRAGIARGRDVIVLAGGLAAARRTVRLARAVSYGWARPEAILISTAGHLAEGGAEQPVRESGTGN